MKRFIRLFSMGLLRDFQRGELRILALALVVAVTAVTAVSFFTDRVERGMQLQAADLLAADLVLRSSQPLPDSYREEVRLRDLQQTSFISFSSVIVSDDEQTQLVDLKAVADAYPLRGQMRIADVAYGEERPSSEIPAVGNVWLDPRLMVSLQLQLGQQVSLGSRSFVISQVLAYEPDRSGDLFQLAPRVLMNSADLAATGLITATSRARYRLLVAGEQAQIADFRDWLEPKLMAGQRLQTVEDARPEMRATLDRGSSFLALASIVAVLVAGAAIAVAAHAFAERQADSTAIMRCLGASQKLLTQILFARLLALGLTASGLGVALGYAAQVGLSQALSGMFNISLPASSFWPALMGLGTGLLTLLGFALPNFLRLTDVPVLRVLRRDLGAPPASVWWVLLSAVAAIALLVAWQAKDLKLAYILLSGVLGSLLVLLLSALLLLRLTQKLRSRVFASWRFGLANISRHAQTSVLQIMAFGIGIMALLLLAVVRLDVIRAWELSLPDDAHNHFLINIQAADLSQVEQKLRDAEIGEPYLYPMIRGRLIAINDKNINPEDFVSDRAQRLVAREFNLSFASEAREDNLIVNGQWWAGEELSQPLASIEDGIAKELGIVLGDRLLYRVGGEDVEVEITNVREVDWDSFRVNFFVVTTPMALEQQPLSYITSFYLPDGDDVLINQLLADFPSITVFDVAALMTQVRNIMERATLAVEYVFLFTLLAGLVVLFAAINASGEQRKRENALMRALGASKFQLRRSLAAEFISLGSLAGLLAASIAGLLGYLLAVFVFQLDYQPNPWLWLMGIGGGGLAVGLAGLLGSHKVISHPPLSILRE